VIKILKEILKRLHGSGSYNKGTRIITFGEITSKGEFNTPLFNKLNQINDENPEQFPVPIIATTLNKADNTNIDDNEKIALDINYINQNDESKVGKVYIPCYGFIGSDYKIYMEDSDDLVKEITGANFRKDVVETWLSGDEMEEAYGQTLTESLKDPWEDSEYKYEYIDNGSYFTIRGTDKLLTYNAHDKYYYPNEEYNTDPDISQYKKFRKNPFYIEQFNKGHQIRLKFRVNQDTMSLYIYVFSPSNKQLALKAWTADPLTYDILKSLESGGSIQVGDLLTVDEWVEDTMYVENIQNQSARDGIGVNSFDFNLISFNFGTSSGFTNTLDWDFEFIRLEQCTGNINDKVEIIGMLGNIAKMDSAFSIQLSEIQDEMKIAARQNFPLQTYKSGIEALFNDYQVPYNARYSVDVQHALLQLFGKYAIPTNNEINESLTFIYNIIDPEGSIIAYGDYDNPYTLVVEINDSDLQFTIDSIDLIQIFVERYRPIPAKVIIKVTFENEVELQEEIKFGEELTLVVISGGTPMSYGTPMGYGTPMSDGIGTSEIDLPADYP
jgi:hypothetical protein